VPEGTKTAREIELHDQISKSYQKGRSDQAEYAERFLRKNGYEEAAEAVKQDNQIPF